jgi:diguanylate cyclase
MWHGAKRSMDRKNSDNYIKEELKIVDYRWLELHFKTAVGVVFAAFIVECIMGIILSKLGQINTTLFLYIIKYLVFPVVVEIIAVLITYFIVKSKQSSQNIKIYAVSSLLVVICFILFSVHSLFSSLYLIFTVPILMTIVYNNYKLTTYTAIISIGAKIISELFIFWDTDKISIMNSAMDIVNFILSICILIGFFAISLIVIYFEKEKNAANLKKELERYELKEKVQIDELTGISNRTALNNRFKEMEQDSEGNSYIFVMVDMDNFKMVNDTFGHATGDKCLQNFSIMLKSSCEQGEAFRFGGDEFCIIFKNVNLARVIELCESLQCEFVKMANCSYSDLPLSLSMGIAEYSKAISTYRLFRNADAALYKAKVHKNSIKVWR